MKKNNFKTVIFLSAAVYTLCAFVPVPLFASGHGCSTQEADRDGDGVPDRTDEFPDDPTRTGNEDLKRACGDQVPAMRLFFIPFGSGSGVMTAAGIESSSVTSLIACSDDGIGGAIKNILGESPSAGNSGSPSSSASSTGTGTTTGSGSGVPSSSTGSTTSSSNNAGSNTSTSGNSGTGASAGSGSGSGTGTGTTKGTGSGSSSNNSGSGTPSSGTSSSGNAGNAAGAGTGTGTGTQTGTGLLRQDHESILKALDCATRVVNGKIVPCKEIYPNPSGGNFWPAAYDQTWKDEKCGQKDTDGLLMFCIPTNKGIVAAKTEPGKTELFTQQLQNAGVPSSVIAGIIAGNLNSATAQSGQGRLAGLGSQSGTQTPSVNAGTGSGGSSSGLGTSVSGNSGLAASGSGTSSSHSDSSGGSSLGTASNGTGSDFDSLGAPLGPGAGLFPNHDSILKTLDCATRVVNGKIVPCKEIHGNAADAGNGNPWPVSYDQTWKDEKCGQKDSDGMLTFCVPTHQGMVIAKTEPEKTELFILQLQNLGVPLQIITGIVTGNLAPALSQNGQGGGLWQSSGCGQKGVECRAFGKNLLVSDASSGTPQISLVSVVTSSDINALPPGFITAAGSSFVSPDADVQSGNAAGKGLGEELFYCGEKDPWGRKIECRAETDGLRVTTVLGSDDASFTALGFAVPENSGSSLDASTVTSENAAPSSDGVSSDPDQCGRPAKDGVYQKCACPLPGKNKKLDKNKIRLKAEFPADKTVFYVDDYGVVLKTRSSKKISDLSCLSDYQMNALAREIQKAAGNTDLSGKTAPRLAS